MPHDNVRFHPKAYRCIVADPPWITKAGPTGGGVSTGDKRMKKWNWRKGNFPSRALPYATMTTAQMATLPFKDIGAENCHLYLWTINAYIEESYEIARSWDFEPRTLLTWSKAPMGGGLGGTFGISSEHILFAIRGRVDARARHTGTVFHWKRPYVNGKPCHSKKPPEFYRMAEKVSHGPRIDLFARERREGWAVWGNEVDSDIEITAP